MLPLLAAALLVQDPPPDPPAPPGVGIELPDGRFILNGNARTVGEALEALRNPTGGISMSDLKKKAEGEGPEAEAAKAEYERLISGKLTESPGTAGPTIGRTIRLQWGDPNLPPELRRAVPGQLFGPLVRPRLPSDPLVGALKLTAPDGTVTEYRAEFTPDPPPAPETPPKYRLGIAIDGFEPKGDPPGLVIGKVVEDSPAAKAGIEDRDRVISVGGEPLPSFRVLRVKVAEAAEKGEPLVVKVVRGEGRPDDAAAADAAEAGGDAKVRAVRILQFNIKPEEAPEEDDGEPIIRRLNADAERPFSFDIPVDTRRFQFGPATILSAEDLGLTPQVAEVRVRAAEAQVRAAEAQVEALRANADRQSRLVDAGVQSARKRDEAAAKLAAAEAELSKAKSLLEGAAARTSAGAEADALRDTVRELTGTVETLRAGEAESAAAKAAEAQLREMRAKYGPKHPELIAQQVRLDRLRAAVAESGDPVAVDRAELFDAVRELKSELKELRGELQRMRNGGGN